MMQSEENSTDKNKKDTQHTFHRRNNRSEESFWQV